MRLRNATVLGLISLLAASFFCIRIHLQEPDRGAFGPESESAGTPPVHQPEKSEGIAAPTKAYASTPGEASQEPATNPGESVPGKYNAPTRQNSESLSGVSCRDVLETCTFSDPGIRSLFDQGLEFIQRGEFPEARQTFQSITSFHPIERKDLPPAYWAVALTFFEEGGSENLERAAVRLKDFLAIFEDAPDDLAAAAQIDLAVIRLEQIRSAATDIDRINAAKSAANALQAFVERWPDSQQAYAARISLAYVLRQIPKP
jgi:hypothetical protein